MFKIKLSFNAIAFFLTLFCIINAGCSSEETVDKKMDELLTVYSQNGEFNGCVLVAQNGEVLFKKAYGYADYTAKEPLNTAYQFRLASVSKQFTAMTIMMLMEQGKLQYDDGVVKYLNDFPYTDLTIRHLLTHTSGLPEYGRLFEIERESKGLIKPVVSNRDVYDLLLKYKLPPNFPPGANYEYSNTGYVILALLVEKISGQSFQYFMKENIFNPLGMNRSYVNPPDGQLNDKQRARGFMPNSDGSGFVPNDWNFQNGMYGDGGVISTIDDLLLWDKGLRSGKLVKAKTLKEAFTQVRLNDGTSREYGFGWSVIKQDTGVIVAHGGGWLGYNTGILRDLSTGQTVIQLCNMPGQRVFFSIWDIMNGREVEIPEYVKVTFMVNSDKLTETDSVFIVGNDRKLGGWNPAKVKLQYNQSHLWQRTIPLEKGSTIEYKVTRGNWDSEAIYKQGVVPGNSVLKVMADTLIKIEVPYWKDIME